MSTRTHSTGSAPAAGPGGRGRSPDVANVVARARYMMGDDIARDLTPAQATAWEGLLEVASSVRRDAARRLRAHGDLSVSMLGVMGRLAVADDQTLRQAALADAMGLSVSRVSRIVDILERRDLVTRTPCALDGRATNVTLTHTGSRLTREAQSTVSTFVRSRFFERVSDGEMTILAAVFTRLLSDQTSEPGAGRGGVV